MSDKDKKKKPTAKAAEKPVETPKSEEKPAKKVKPPKQRQPTVQLPVFLEFLYTFSSVMVIIVPLVVAGMAFATGVEAMQIFLRTLVALVVTGLLLLLLTSVISSGAIEAARKDMEDKHKAEQNKPAQEDSAAPSSLADVQA